MLKLLEAGVRVGGYTFLIIGGLFGNTAIAYIILSHKIMHTATNWLVFNLSLSGILIAIFTIPTALFMQLGSGHWTAGELACRLLGNITECFAGVCVLTHTCVAIARYWIVSRRQGICSRTIRVTIGAIWCLSFFFLSALLMGVLGDSSLTLHSKDNTTFYICERRWYVIGGGTSASANISFDNSSSSTSIPTLIPLSTSGVSGSKIYISLAFLLTYILPIVLTGFAYQQIVRISKQSLRRVSCNLASDDFKTREKSNRRMNKILMNMYAIFAVTTFPWQITYFLRAYVPSFRPDSTFLMYLFALFYAQIVAMPIILFYQSVDYRSRLYNLPICCCIDQQKFTFFAEQFRYQLFETADSIGRKVSTFRKISNVSGFWSRSQTETSSTGRLSNITSYSGDAEHSSDRSFFATLRTFSDTDGEDDVFDSRQWSDSDSQERLLDSSSVYVSRKGSVSFSTDVTILKDIREPSWSSIPRKSSLLSRSRKATKGVPKMSAIALSPEEGGLGGILEEGCEEENNEIEIGECSKSQSDIATGQISPDTWKEHQQIPTYHRQTSLPTVQDFAGDYQVMKERKYSTPILTSFHSTERENEINGDDHSGSRRKDSFRGSSNVDQLRHLGEILKQFRVKRTNYSPPQILKQHSSPARDSEHVEPVIELRKKHSLPSTFDLTYTSKENNCSILQKADLDNAGSSTLDINDSSSLGTYALTKRIPFSIAGENLPFTTENLDCLTPNSDFYEGKDRNHVQVISFNHSDYGDGVLNIRDLQETRI